MLFLLFLLLIVNAAISAWDAYAAGRMWREASGWIKAVAWSALVMSACGFLMVSTIVLGFVATSLGYLDHRAADALWAVTYLAIILPVLGSGLIITMHSWMEAWRRRDFGSMATAGWNTFAQSSNTYDALDGGIGGAFSTVKDFFTSKDDNEDASDMATRAAVLVVLGLALVATAGLTYEFFAMGRRAAAAEARDARADGMRRFAG